MLNQNDAAMAFSPSVPTQQRDAAWIARQLAQAPHQFIDVGHSQLAYWKFGSGPDLVFVHGWPLHAATFRAVVPALAESFTCHLLDLPGAGKSVSAATAPIDFQSHVSALRSALDALQVNRYSLLAHDSGGVVARLLAASDRRVRRMVLWGTEIPGHRSALVQLFALLSHLPFGAALLRLALSFRMLRRSALAFGPCLARLDHLDGDFDALFVAPLRASNAAATYQLEPLRTLDWRLIDELAATHARIEAPTQLIWGSKDGLFPVERARRMVHQFAGGALFCEIAGGKAFLHEDMPEALLEVALPFLRSLLGPEVQAS
ncbi:MAG: alpha/beta hydrolase fold [Myxococcaceae bacterium]|nr:alpha/beta hydrolase fold [Myxococcaceae bacterium]